MLNDAESDDAGTLPIVEIIARLEAAGHHVHEDAGGGYLVTKWSLSRHCLDGESLQAFAEQVGAI